MLQHLKGYQKSITLIKTGRLGLIIGDELKWTSHIELYFRK